MNTRSSIPAWQAFALSMVVVCGCSENQTVQDARIRIGIQIEFLNSTLDEYSPGNQRKSTIDFVKRSGFDFLLSKKLDEIPNLRSNLDRLNLRHRELLAQDWCSKFLDETVFYSVYSNLWELEPKDQAMDLLVVACQDDTVVGWKLFALCPY